MYFTFSWFLGLMSNSDGSDVPTTARAGAEQIFIGNDVEGWGYVDRNSLAAANQKSA